MIGKMIYDMSKDELREVTQEDLDEIMSALQVSRYMVMFIRAVEPRLAPDPGPNFHILLKDRLETYLKDRHLLVKDRLEAYLKDRHILPP